MNTWKIVLALPLGLGAWAALGTAATALAKPGAAPPAGTATAPPSALPEEVQAIHGLIGEWRGSGSAQFGADKSSTQFQLSCTPASGGFGVQCKTHFSGLPGGGSFEETDLFGFDPGQRKYHWFSVTNLGETHDHVAQISATDTLRFVYDGVQEGKPLQEVITLRVAKNQRELEFQSTVTLAGQPVGQLSGRGTK